MTNPDILPPADSPSLDAVHPLDAMRSEVESVEALARLMDSKFTVPFTQIPIGLDTLVGLVPGIGDTVGLGISGWIVARAHRLGVGKPTLVKMGGNIFVDWLIGLVPVIGDLFDWGWKANNRNAALLREHFEREVRRHGPTPDMMRAAGGVSTL